MGLCNNSFARKHNFLELHNIGVKMRKFITKVTVTGADDSIHQHRLVELAEEYPFVEFGILLSRDAMGRNRFPSRKWLQNLISLCSGREMNFAGHINGAWVKELLIGHWPTQGFIDIDDDFMAPDVFSRWQINTHAIPHKVDYDRLSDLLRSIKANGQTVIFQYDEVNTGLVNHSMKAGSTNISALFDVSHGAGVLPVKWPKPLPNIDCGYAGGLSPENVAGQIERIAIIVGDRKIWIDAETKLRSPDDFQFDLRKVRAFLEAAKPWVL
jgi:hypothetical protein